MGHSLDVESVSGVSDFDLVKKYFECKHANYKVCGWWYNSGTCGGKSTFNISHILSNQNRTLCDMSS